MSTITEAEKRYLEKILDMGDGYVLDYTDATFGALFGKHQILIHDQKYCKYGTSKAKKMRAFWELEPDDRVASVLDEMLESYEADCAIKGTGANANVLVKCRAAAGLMADRAHHTPFPTRRSRNPPGIHYRKKPG